jgi:alpha-L-rhamnosidase
MKYFSILIVVLLLATSSLHAQELNVSGYWSHSKDAAYATDWQAQWIWTPEPPSESAEPADSEENSVDMLLARKAFNLTEVPTQAVLSITAGTRYQLYVNGGYVCGGPARCAPHHQSFDALNVAPFLREGKNVLAIRVHHQREGVSYYGESRAGLLAQLDYTIGSQESTIVTDGKWSVRPDESWSNASPVMARFHLEACDRVDLRQRASDWTALEYDDSDWMNAQVLARDEGWPTPQRNDRPTHLIPPWTSLVARDIPYLNETIVEAERLVYQGSVAEPSIEYELNEETWAGVPAISRIDVPREEVELTSPTAVAPNVSGECRVLVFDLEEVRNGRPYLDIEGPPGTVVDVMCAPYLLEDSLISPIVVSSYIDRIVLSGKREQWEAFYMKPTRWMAVVFRHLPGEATLHEAGVIETKYPFVQQGEFHAAGAPELEALWEASAKTVEVCTTDAYTDNYRERRQYAQTSYYACLGNYPVFGDYALQRRYLMQIAQEQLPNGIMPAYAPRHGDDFMVILDSNCFWLKGLYQYLLYSGDRETTRDFLPTARQLLQLLNEYTNDDGLIDGPPYPYWLDHALNDRRGANFCFNAHYLGSLENFAQVLDWLGEPGAETHQQQAQRMRAAMQEKFWDPERRLYVDALIDGERSDQFSEHANAMALAMKIGTPEQRHAVGLELQRNEPHDYVRRESGLVMATPAMSYYLYTGLCEEGYLDDTLDMAWSRFKHMLDPDTNGTLWEEWSLEGSGRTGTFRKVASGRSDAQTESAFFPSLFTRYILGVEPTQPGLEEIVLHYCPSFRLLQHGGTVPTPRGPLEVEWDVKQSEVVLAVEIPPSTTVKVDLARFENVSLHRVTVNNTPLAAHQIEDGFLLLPPGEWIVRATE